MKQDDQSQTSKLILFYISRKGSHPLRRHTTSSPSILILNLKIQTKGQKWGVTRKHFMTLIRVKRKRQRRVVKSPQSAKMRKRRKKERYNIVEFPGKYKLPSVSVTYWNNYFSIFWIQKWHTIEDKVSYILAQGLWAVVDCRDLCWALWSLWFFAHSVEVYQRIVRYGSVTYMGGEMIDACNLSKSQALYFARSAIRVKYTINGMTVLIVP